MLEEKVLQFNHVSMIFISLISLFSGLFFLFSSWDSIKKLFHSLNSKYIYILLLIILLGIFLRIRLTPFTRLTGPELIFLRSVETFGHNSGLDRLPGLTSLLLLESTFFGFNNLVFYYSNILLSGVMIFAIFIITYLVSEDARAGIIAAFFTSTIPQLILYSGTLDSEVVAPVFASVSFTIFFLYKKTKQTELMYSFLFFLMFTIQTKFEYILLLPAVFFLLPEKDSLSQKIMENIRNREFYVFWVILLLVLILFIPFFTGHGFHGFAKLGESIESFDKKPNKYSILGGIKPSFSSLSFLSSGIFDIKKFALNSHIMMLIILFVFIGLLFISRKNILLYYWPFSILSLYFVLPFVKIEQSLLFNILPPLIVISSIGIINSYKKVLEFLDKFEITLSRNIVFYIFIVLILFVSFFSLSNSFLVNKNINEKGYSVIELPELIEKNLNRIENKNCTIVGTMGSVGLIETELRHETYKEVFKTNPEDIGQRRIGEIKREYECLYLLPTFLSPVYIPPRNKNFDYMLSEFDAEIYAKYPSKRRDKNGIYHFKIHKLI